jgi:TolA-binding protein
VPLIWFHHAVALAESGGVGEASVLLEKLRKQHPDRPESREAILRLAECRWLEGTQKVNQANEALGNPELKQDEAARLRRAVEEGQKAVREVVRQGVEEARRLKKENPGDGLAARMLYQGAWAYRIAADAEVNEARGKLQEKLQREVPLAQVELQPSEKKARELYQELIADFAEHPLAMSSRLELAEAFADRDDFAPAIKLLNEAIDREPSADMTDRIRLRLGMCHLGRNDVAAALRQFEVVGARRESGWAVHGLMRAGECRMMKKEWDEAVNLFAVFRDEEALQGVGGWSDRALLRLGHALLRLQRWDDARKAFDLLPERFADSGWVPAARYGAGWALLKQKKYAEAAASFAQAGGEEPGPVSDRARIAGCVCELEQKKYKEAIEVLQSVAAKTAEADVKAFALLEAGHAAVELGQRDLAAKLLKQVADEFAETPWAAAAKERMMMKPGQAAPHALPAAESLLTPDLAEPLPLESLGQMQSDWVPADDPSDDQSLAVVLARVPPERKTPFGARPQATPDPFEYREMMRGRIPPDEPRLASQP